MPACPLCEHVQENGDSCEVCGRVLAERIEVVAAVDVLPGLEQTRWEEPFPEDTNPIAELELTTLPAAAVPDLPMANMERTALPATGLVPALAPLEDMDLGRAPDDGMRSQIVLGAVICRYCKNTQKEGAFCDKCGMRLERMKAAPPPSPPPAEEQVSRCRRCSEKVVLGTRCRSCGMLARLEAEGGLG